MPPSQLPDTHTHTHFRADHANNFSACSQFSTPNLTQVCGVVASFRSFQTDGRRLNQSAHGGDLRECEGFEIKFPSRGWNVKPICGSVKSLSYWLHDDHHQWKFILTNPLPHCFVLWCRWNSVRCILTALSHRHGVVVVVAAVAMRREKVSFFPFHLYLQRFFWSDWSSIITQADTALHTVVCCFLFSCICCNLGKFHQKKPMNLLYECDAWGVCRFVLIED